MPVSGPGPAPSNDRRWLIALAAGLALLLVAAGLLIPPRAPALPYPSSYSPLPSGALAAFRLLRASGYQARRWRLPLAALPNGAHTVLVLADPILAPAAATAAGRRNWWRLARFLRQGGTVLATGAAGARMAAGWGGRASPGPEALFPPLAPGPAAAAGEIRMRPRWSWPLAPARGVALFGGPRRAVVVAAPVGAGRLILWAAATPLTNAGLRRPANLALFLAAAGAPAGPKGIRRRVLWDEYFHGARQGWAGFLGMGGLPWILLPLGLVLAAAWMTFGRRWGPWVGEPAMERDSPLEFAAAAGALYERARAADLALAIVREAATRARGGGPAVATEPITGRPPAPGPGGGEEAALREYRRWAARLAAKTLKGS